LVGRSTRTVKKNENMLEPIRKIIGAGNRGGSGLFDEFGRERTRKIAIVSVSARNSLESSEEVSRRRCMPLVWRSASQIKSIFGQSPTTALATVVMFGSQTPSGRAMTGVNASGPQPRRLGRLLCHR
jgi:hypothetical protein